MRFYRIKQIGENKFIPQTASLLDLISMTWDGIYLINNINCGRVFQEDYYACKTLEEAREVIKKYKEHIKIKSQKVKYHKP